MFFCSVARRAPMYHIISETLIPVCLLVVMFEAVRYVTEHITELAPLDNIRNCRLRIVNTPHKPFQTRSQND